MAVRSTSGLLALAQQAAANGDHERAVWLYERLQLQLERLPPYPGQSLDVAGMLMNRGISLDAGGDPAAAEALYAAAQKLFDAQPADDDPSRLREALLWMNRGVCLSTLGRYEEADRWNQQAQQVFDDHPSSEEARRHGAVIRRNRARNLHRQGRLQQAEALYAEAAERFAALPLRQREALQDELGSLVLGRAGNALALGRFERADRLYAELEARLAADVQGMYTRHQLAGVRLSRAVVAQRLGRHAEAEAGYRAAQEGLDELPGSPRILRASVRMSRADNLSTMGLHDVAEECLVEAEALFKQLPDALEADQGIAGVLINRANALYARARYAEAEALQSEIESRLAGLPESRDVIEARFIACNSHGLSLQALGRYDAAADCLRAAVQWLGRLEDSDAVRRQRITLLMNQANNENLCKRHAQAERLFQEALRLLEALPEAESVRTARALGGLNRLSNLIEAGGPGPAGALWLECFESLRALQGHPNADLQGMATSLMQALVALSADAAISPEACERHAMALCRWILDWTDIAADPLSAQPPGAEQLATTFGLVSTPATFPRIGRSKFPHLRRRGSSALQ